MVGHKRKPWVLALHIAIVAILTLTALAGHIGVVLAITLTHLYTDAIKTYLLPDNVLAFVVDQTIQLAY